MYLSKYLRKAHTDTKTQPNQDWAHVTYRPRYQLYLLLSSQSLLPSGALPYANPPSTPFPPSSLFLSSSLPLSLSARRPRSLSLSLRSHNSGLRADNTQINR